MRVWVAAAAFLAALAGAVQAQVQDRAVPQSPAHVQIALPPDQGRGEEIVDGPNPLQGARVANLTPALANELRMDLTAKGVVVTAAAAASQAARSGFQRGDIIRQINGENTLSVERLRRSLDEADQWRVTIQRGNRVMQLGAQ